MFNLAPWYYRELLNENTIIEKPEFYSTTSLTGEKKFEVVVTLKENLRPSWIPTSSIYRNCDGSGADKYKNIATYKAISESLERWAFYSSVDSRANKYGFEFDPTTTGIAAFPSWHFNQARKNARAEAIERWCIHEFNRGNIPIKNHTTLISNLLHFELVSPFSDTFVSLLCYAGNSFYSYGFAADTSLNKSFNKALVELDRNYRMLDVYYSKNSSEAVRGVQLLSTVDKTIIFYSTKEGYLSFEEKINKSPCKVMNKSPKILCDQELIGDWSKYTKVWRFLLEDSYYDCSSDHTFFMF